MKDIDKPCLLNAGKRSLSKWSLKGTFFVPCFFSFIYTYRDEGKMYLLRSTCLLALKSAFSDTRLINWYRSYLTYSPVLPCKPTITEVWVKILWCILAKGSVSGMKLVRVNKYLDTAQTVRSGIFYHPAIGQFQPQCVVVYFKTKKWQKNRGDEKIFTL